MRSNLRLISIIAALGGALFVSAASAQELVPYEDDTGRLVWVDPYTGEIVRDARNNRQRNLRNERRGIRQQRRRERRRRMERELNSLFDLDRNDSFDFRNRPQRDRGFYLDEYEERETDRIERRKLPKAEPRKRSDAEQTARLPEPIKRKESRPSWYFAKPAISKSTIARLQVFLDREGFSPGVIDGAWGHNVVKALRAWQEATGSNANLSNPLILEAAAKRAGRDAFTTYTITSADVNGDFVSAIPSDYADKALMKKMAYTSSLEQLAERFHMNENYLLALNPNIDFNNAGARIKVANTGQAVTQSVHYVLADKAREQVRAYNRNGKLVVAYPATIGSAATPSPSGKVEVARIALDPNYTYNPKKNFKQGDNDKVLTIPPGPNGPVGSVWIALSKPTYGIHGTPNPATIGKTNSHGCIRLTNWDARELAKLVRKGVTVEFVE